MKFHAKFLRRCLFINCLTYFDCAKLKCNDSCLQWSSAAEEFFNLVIALWGGKLVNSATIPCWMVLEMNVIFLSWDFLTVLEQLGFDRWVWHRPIGGSLFCRQLLEGLTYSLTLTYCCHNLCLNRCHIRYIQIVICWSQKSLHGICMGCVQKFINVCWN